MSFTGHGRFFVVRSATPSTFCLPGHVQESRQRYFKCVRTLYTLDDAVAVLQRRVLTVSPLVESNGAQQPMSDEFAS